MLKKLLDDHSGLIVAEEMENIVIGSPEVWRVKEVMEGT